MTVPMARPTPMRPALTLQVNPAAVFFGREAAQVLTPAYLPGTAHTNDNSNGSAHTNESSINYDQCNINPTTSKEAAHNGLTPLGVNPAFP